MQNRWARLLIGQTIISIYGGYFGAGMGVLMIALYLVASSLDVHSASGLRMVCSCVINILAVILFAWRGALVYSSGVPMLIASILGGYIGAHAGEAHERGSCPNRDSRLRLGADRLVLRPPFVR